VVEEGILKSVAFICAVKLCAGEVSFSFLFSSKLFVFDVLPSWGRSL
jgi:hypothetical protein